MGMQLFAVLPLRLGIILCWLHWLRRADWGGERIRLGRDLTDRALGLTLGGKRYSSQSSNTTPHRLMAQAIVVGTDHTIICWRTSLMPIMRLTTQNMLSLK